MSKKSDLPKRGPIDKIGDRCAAFARRPWFRILTMSVATVLVVMLIFFSAGWLFKDQTSFSISIGDDDSSKLISLSESKDFSSPTVRLNAGGLGSVTNIDGLTIPETFESEGGSHNGSNYIAYTFYLKNVGNETIDVRSDLDITSVLKGADEAIRIKVYRNGIDTTYAKLNKNGKAVYNTTPFLWNGANALVAEESEEAEDSTAQTEQSTEKPIKEGQVFSVVEENLKPNDTIKYTFVVWLEGNDPECGNDIKGGNVKMSLTFSVDDAET